MISELQDGTIVFEVARRMALTGEKIDFLFTSKACQHANDTGLISSLGFAEGVHCLEPDLSQIGDEKSVGGVRSIDYSGWVELVEVNEKIVSWA